MAAEGRAAVGACGFPQPSLLARPGKVSPALVFALAEVKERTVAGAQILPHPQRHWGRPAWVGEGNGNPLQCSCLENPRDGGVCWAAVYGVAQSRTRLK